MRRATVLAVVAVLCAFGGGNAAPRGAAPPLHVALLLAPNEIGDPSFNDAALAGQAKVKIIGVEADQHRLAPEAVITSMRKRLDRAIETTINEVRHLAFRGGVVEMTLANGGVDLVLPGLLAPATVKLVEKARTAVVSGRTPACVKPEDRPPAWNFPPRPVTPEAEDPPEKPSRRTTPRGGRR